MQQRKWKNKCFQKEMQEKTVNVYQLCLCPSEHQLAKLDLWKKTTLTIKKNEIMMNAQS